MLRMRALLSWTLVFAVLAGSLPARGVSPGAVATAAASEKKSDKRAKRPKPPKPPKPPRVQRPPKPPRPRRPSGRTGRSRRAGRNRDPSRSDKKDRTKREEKRWYVVQMGTDLRVAEAKTRPALRKTAVQKFRTEKAAYKKRVDAAKKAGKKYDGPKPTATAFKTHPRAGFSTEKKAKAYLAKIKKQIERKKPDKKRSDKRKGARKKQPSDKKKQPSDKKKGRKKKDSGKKKAA